MTVTSGFFDSLDGDRKYTAEQIGNYFEGIIGNGIFKEIGNEFAVQAGSGMNIKIGTGKAFINCHWIKNDAVLTLPIAAADKQYDRKDAIKLRLDTSETSRSISIIVDTGSPNSSWKAPVRSGSVYELVIAYVNVSAGATSITQSDITDCRSTQYCGRVALDANIETGHPDISTSNPNVATTPTTLENGDVFAAVINIARDDNGHTTNFEVRTFKLSLNLDTKNVIAPAPTVPVNITGDTVYLNHVEDGTVKSSHKIIGAGGANVASETSGTNDFDGIIKITSSCVKNGTITHDSANMTIDTGFTETPKIFKLYYTTDGSTVELAVECRPELDAPFNFINHSGLPINSVDFNGGVATVNCSVSTGLTFMWEAYI